MQEALSKLAYASGHREFVRPATEPRPATLLFEFAVVGFAMLGLVAAELMLSSAICGTNFAGGDGKMAQAIILAVYKSVVSFILTISILFKIAIAPDQRVDKPNLLALRHSRRRARH